MLHWRRKIGYLVIAAALVALGWSGTALAGPKPPGKKPPAPGIHWGR